MSKNAFPCVRGQAINTMESVGAKLLYDVTREFTTLLLDVAPSSVPLQPPMARMIAAWTLIKRNKRQDDLALFCSHFYCAHIFAIGHIFQFYERIRTVCFHWKRLLVPSVSSVQWRNNDAPHSLLNELYREKVLKMHFFASFFHLFISILHASQPVANGAGYYGNEYL